MTRVFYPGAPLGPVSPVDPGNLLPPFFPFILGDPVVIYS